MIWGPSGFQLAVCRLWSWCVQLRQTPLRGILFWVYPGLESPKRTGYKWEGMAVFRSLMLYPSTVNMNPRLKQKWVFPTFIQRLQANWWSFASSTFCEYPILPSYIAVVTARTKYRKRNEKWKHYICWKSGKKTRWVVVSVAHRRWKLIVEYNKGNTCTIFVWDLDWYYPLWNIWSFPSFVTSARSSWYEVSEATSSTVATCRRYVGESYNRSVLMLYSAFCMHVSVLLVYESHLYVSSWHFILACMQSGIYW